MMTIEDIKRKITERFPETVFIDKSEGNNLHLEFRTETQIDYRYNIWCGTKPIWASVGASLLNAKENQYFWYYPFDLYGSENIEKNQTDCIDFILEQLNILTKYKTRIIQKKNWFSQTFICEYFTNENWIMYYKHSAVRIKFEFPKIEGQRKIYE